jgi:hypothetical protein
MKHVLPGAIVLAALSGCGFGSEAAFIDTAALNDCLDELPVCNTTAGCKLVEEESYLEGKFPGQRSFIVPTEGEAVIRVKLFWRTRLGPGADTEIVWFEPACVDDFNYESQGADIFRDTNDQGIFIQEQRVFRAGEHLVQVRSDAVAEYLLRTEVLTKSEFEQEQASNDGLF